MATTTEPIAAVRTFASPRLSFKSAAKALEFYKNAFGAKVQMNMPGPDGKIMHAEIQIGNSMVFLADEVMGNKSAETLGTAPVGFYVYVENADQAFQKALRAGAKEKYPVSDMFWGDRMGALQDPFGYTWTLATHTKDLSPDEMKRAQDEWFKQMAGAR